MAAAPDAGGAHRAAQARVPGDPGTDRRWRFNLSDLGRPYSQGRSYRPAARRDGWLRAKAQGGTSGVVGMTRAGPNPGQAAKRPVAAAPGASLPLDASVLSIVANLEGLDFNGLRRQWRAHLGGEPPTHPPRWLLMRVLAYRLQSDAFGGLDKSIQRDSSLWERGWRRRFRLCGRFGALRKPFSARRAALSLHQVGAALTAIGTGKWEPDGDQ